MTFMLLQGKHELLISLKEFGDTCGILPVGEEAHVTTKGLKWDLGPGSCEFALDDTSIDVSGSSGLRARVVKLC